MFRMISVSILILGIVINAQNRHEPDRKNFGKRFEQLENIKLIELLNMDEETSLKFFARRNEMKNKIQKHMKENHDLISSMENLIDEDKKNKDFSDLIKKSQEIDKEMYKIRSDFFISLKDILSQEQIAKVIVFEFKFKRNVRDMLLERGRRKFIE